MRPRRPTPPPHVSAPVVLPDYDELPLLGDGRVRCVPGRSTTRPIVAASRDAEMRRFRLLPPHTRATRRLRSSPVAAGPGTASATPSGWP